MFDLFAGKKTLIVNILVLAATILGGQFGFDVPWFHTKEALEVLAAVNVALRFLTKGPQSLV